MTPQHHRTARAIAFAFALTAPFAPVARADPQPLAKAESAIAASHSSASLTVRPNADEQTATRARANTGPCSEVCSAGGYGIERATAWTPDESGAILPHDSRPRSIAAASLYSTASNGPASQTSSAPGHSHVALVRSGPGVRAYYIAGTETSAARVDTRGRGFDWGDAAIGAGAGLLLVGIGLAGARVATNSRSRHIRRQRATASS